MARSNSYLFFFSDKCLGFKGSQLDQSDEEGQQDFIVGCCIFITPGLVLASWMYSMARLLSDAIFDKMDSAEMRTLLRTDVSTSEF